MGTLIGLLVVLLIIAVVLWAIRAVLAAFHVPDPFSTVIFVIAVLICVLWAIGYLGMVPHLNFPR